MENTEGSEHTMEQALEDKDMEGGTDTFEPLASTMPPTLSQRQTHTEHNRK